MSEPLPTTDAVTRCLERIRHLATPADNNHWVADPPAVAAAEKLLAARPGLAPRFYIYASEDGGININIIPSMTGVNYEVGISASGEVEICCIFHSHPEDDVYQDFSGLDAEALAFLDGLIGGAA